MAVEKSGIPEQPSGNNSSNDKSADQPKGQDTLSAQGNGAGERQTAAAVKGAPAKSAATGVSEPPAESNVAAAPPAAPVATRLIKQRAIVKPQYRNGGGNGGSPPPPDPPGLTIAISSPQNGAAIVGNNPGVSLTVTCSVEVRGLSTGLWVTAMKVYVQLGGATRVQATLSTGSILAGGLTTWAYTGPTPTGGTLSINAHVDLFYGYNNGGDIESKDAETTTVTASTVNINPVSPYDGQVFVGTSTGWLTSTSGTASTSSPATITSVTWTLLNGAGQQVGTGTLTGPFGTTTCTWSGYVQVPLGNYSIQFTAIDSNDNPKNPSRQTAVRRIQVALTADVLDISAPSYLRALVDFATKPFTSFGDPRIIAGSNGDLKPALLDTTFYRSLALLLDENYAAKANEAVYQARVCVEVLRKYIAQNPPTSPQAQALAAAESAYQLTAYQALLQQAGTSFDEIRLARTYNRQDPHGLANAQALAARLGIDVGSPTDPYGGYIGDHLDRLCFTTAGAPDTTLTFQLTATDSAGATATETVTVIARGNTPLIRVSAGNNQTVNKGATVPLNASATSLTLGAAIATYQWSQLAGPAVTLSNAGTASASFVAPTVAADTVFTFQVVVTDNKGAHESSAVNVTVSAATRTLLVSAGSSQMVEQGDAVNLVGGATDTTAGATVTYSWRQISGPQVQLVNPTTATAGFAAPALVHPVGQLSEQDLERTFGLVDSQRDPFSQGAAIGDLEGLITRWSIRGVDWKRATDADGTVYLDLEFVASGGPSQINLFADRGRRTVLAFGEGSLPGEIILSPIGNSGVTGRVTVGKVGQFSGYMIGLSVFPRLLSWRRQHLRAVWLEQDYAFVQGQIVGDLQDQIVTCKLTGALPGNNTDASGTLYLSLEKTAGPSYTVSLYKDASRTALVASGAILTSTGQIALAAANNSGLSGTVGIAYAADSIAISVPITFTQAPLIDPDLLMPGDFKHPTPDDPAFSLYVARQTTVQGWLSQLSSQAGGTLRSLNSNLQSTLKDPEFYPAGMQIADILALNGKALAGEDISPQLEAVNLPLDAFGELVQLCPIVQSGFPILDSEWSDIYSILVQVQKTRSYSAWAIAESNASLTLGPDEFISPPRLPALANTGIDTTSLALPNGAVDPRWTIVSTPSGAVSAPVYVTNNTYPLGVAWIANDDTSCWISPHADESGNTNNGNPNPGEPPGLYTYRTTVDLTGYDPASVVLDLQVSVDDELRAVRINGVGTGLSAVGYSGITPLTLTGPFKPGVNTLDFVVFNAGATANPSGFRVAFSFANTPVVAPLPRRRSTAQQRQQWQDSLKARIDQDSSLAASVDFAADQTEQQTLWQLRDALVAACALTSSVPTLYSTGTNFAQIPQFGGVFIDLAWRITAVPTGAPTGYVFIPQSANPAWLANDAGSSWIAPSANEINGPLDAPGNYTYHTTFDLSLFDPSSVQVNLAVAVDNSVTAINLNGQSLGFTAASYTALTPFTISEGFIQGMNTLDIVVNNAGATPNPSGLRVQFASTAPVPVSAGWMSQTLLIDVTSTGRQKISRLSEGTTMMQGLVFSLRNGEFQQLTPSAAASFWTLNEDASLFDQEWYWMGSYPNWAAIMRVFLYPANLLLPTMRMSAAASNGQPGLIAERTTAFDDFVSALDNLTPLTPKGCLTKAQAYVTELKTNAAQANPRYDNLLPADLVAPSFAYPDPSTADLNLLLWGPAAADWSVPAAIPFVWEAWYFVPIHIALELQKSGQFEAALDWFRLAYRYDLPLVNGSDNNRRTFYGLQIESANLTQFRYVQTPSWMIDSANPHQIAPSRFNPYTRFTLFSIASCLLDFADAQFGTETEESIAIANLLYLEAQTVLSQVEEVLPSDPVTESNPVFAALQQRAASRLFSLNSGRNIAGMLLPDSTTAQTAISIQPSAYRYSALMDRAKQLVTLAQQVEATYLASMEKQDNETYTELKANQDLETSNATVRLQQLQLQTATDGIGLASDQVAKAQNGVDHYNALIGSDIVSQEETAIGFQWAAVGLQAASAAVSVASLADPIADLFGGGGNLASGLSSLASAASTTSSVLNAQSSLEEKQMDWQFGLSLAHDDVAAGQQQVVIASDQQAAAAQQLTISQLQSDHAQATVNFLANKFTNADLYRWMSGVLGGVYAYFLQQAAAMARLAESQLAFERQQTALSVIRPSYWQPLSSANLGSRGAQGLTGAETLLEDITTLDQYAFATDRIKLQMTKVISLALLDPYAFQEFTSTGQLRFSTPMDLFDRDFPGHYLRLISQVRVSVAALVPPGLGIRATLANSGISRVAVIDDSGVFQSVMVQRDPQMIALSSPSNSNGMFQLTQTSQPNLLQPFEDLGVDTTWEFTMPKAANQFDYSTVADVQISVDYTAFYNAQYSQQIAQQLSKSLTADRAYSFKQQFPDAWYALNNSTQYQAPFSVQFQSMLGDFPTNILNIRIAQLLLYFIPADGANFQLQPALFFTSPGSSTQTGGVAGAAADPTAPPTYVFSTRRGNASNWVPILGAGVAGNWTLTLSNTVATAAIFQNQKMQDILFVITYSADLPPWPS